MGWLFTHGATRSDIIKSRIKTEENETRRYETLKHCLVGNVLWTVNRITVKETGEEKLFIGCDLLRAQRGYGWGYKDMEESSHPFYYSCPLAYLEMVPEKCAAWREGVRKYHRKLVVGQTYKLANCRIPEITITSLRPLCGQYGGLTYRIRKALIA
jgi:hypothetical protein